MRRTRTTRLYWRRRGYGMDPARDGQQKYESRDTGRHLHFSSLRAVLRSRKPRLKSERTVPLDRRHHEPRQPGWSRLIARLRVDLPISSLVWRCMTHSPRIAWVVTILLCSAQGEPASETAPLVATEWAVRKVVDAWKRLGDMSRWESIRRPRNSSVPRRVVPPFRWYITRLSSSACIAKVPLPGVHNTDLDGTPFRKDITPYAPQGEVAEYLWWEDDAIKGLRLLGTAEQAMHQQH